MDKTSGKIKLNDELLKGVSGGIEDMPTSFTREPCGSCPYCGGIKYKVIETGYLGPFEYEKSHYECDNCGPCGV